MATVVPSEAVSSPVSTLAESLLKLPNPLPIPTPAPAPVVTALASPSLGGAVGCDFRSSLNQLLFVEFSGNLSRMNLFPSATVVSSGSAVLKGTFTFDLDKRRPSVPVGI